MAAILPLGVARAARRKPQLRDTAVAFCQRRVEDAFERGFRACPLVDLRGALRSLPLVVQCAVRVHDRREPGGPLVLGVDVHGANGRMVRRPVLVSLHQRQVVIFSEVGDIDAAGDLHPAPPAPIEPGARWTRIDWVLDPGQRDWY